MSISLLSLSEQYLKPNKTNNMENLIIKVLFGHFVGDFFFQSKMMSDTKYRSGWKGIFWCSVHVLIYTLFIAMFVGNFSPIFLLGVFIPHWLIDKWSLAHKWMTLMGRGDLISSPDPRRASFGAIIYVVIDQTLHFGCLYILLNLI